MSTLLIIVLILLIFGGIGFGYSGGGTYPYRQWATPGVGGILVVLLVLYLLGVFR